MAKGPAPPESLAARFRNDDERWSAVLSRDHSADGQFLYCVTTTGIYCR
ncbi:MAG: bifunctional transcriptional activator/DNA repair enzyme protein Ada, partial [Chloroflexi bacterium]|nr:bifunctional transcriptional activator/DNA repair enzyme protein Ada [Chloroflexota bacterium]